MTSSTSPAAPSDTVRLRQKLAASLDEGVYVDVVESIPSTNTALKESADSSDQHVLLALEQTAGVGRRGGAWLSPRVLTCARLLTIMCALRDDPVIQRLAGVAQ
jgi:BirA family biotin operon repressor/biotin-[acetyl-CoA-carboxylase] ligase